MMTRKRMAALVLALLLAFACLPLSGASAATLRTAVVKGGWLRLRAGASFEATTLASYSTGTVVTVDAMFGKWYHVIAPDGRRGYMYSDYLTLQGGGGVVGTATVTSANGRGVRLRTGPGTGYSVLGLYPVGTQADILQRGTSWHYVRIGSHKGYMMSKYLYEGTTPPPGPTQEYTAWVTSRNGRGVNLRRGPGKGYASIGLYAVGTQVTVIRHNAEWDYIRVGTRTGYMMNQYLTRTVPSVTVTGVGLSNYYPVVGETLVAVLNPSNATVNYTWKDDYGTVLGNGPTCYVTGSMVGRRIYVYVTGVGACTGSATSSYTAQVTYAGGLITPSPTQPVPTATPAPTTPQQEALYGSLRLPGAAVVGTTLAPEASLNTTNVRYQWYVNDVYIGNGGSLKLEPYMAGCTVKVVAVPTSSWFVGSVSSAGCAVVANVTTKTDLN